MKIFKLPMIAVAAAVLTGCGFAGTTDEPATATAASATATTVPSHAAPPATASAAAPAATAKPAAAKPQEKYQTSGPHIDASAFLNALVESGCQIDKAEYKEVKRGGAIKIVCSKKIDPLNVELDDL